MNYREFGGSLVGLFWTIEKMVDYCWKGHGSVKKTVVAHKK